jgi:hypothetical protein
MRKNPGLKTTLPACITFVALVIGARAQTYLATSYTNTFDTGGNTTPFTGGSVASWINWYGLGFNNTAMTNDPTMDAQNNTNSSGSLLVISPFGTAGDQNVFFGTFDNGGGYDNSKQIPLNIITGLSFDIHVAPGTQTNSAGNFGSIQVALVDPGWHGGDIGFFTALTIPGAATNGWVHLSDTNILSDIKAMVLATGYTNAAGVVFDYNSYSGYPTFPVTFWIDNVAVTVTNIAPPPPPPPTISAPVTARSIIPGLNIFAENVVADQYQRDEIELLTHSGIGWLGNQSATYSFTITNFPPPADAGYQAHIFISTGPATATAFDYNDANLLWLNVQQNTNGTAAASFRYKIDEPNSNSNLFGAEYISTNGGASAGTIATLPAPTVLGTWGFTISGTSNVTVFGPGGSSTNFSLRGVVASTFVEPLYVAFGAQPNTATNTFNGQDVVLANAAVTNSGTAVVFDNFQTDASLNTSLWETLEGEPNTVQLFANDPNQLLVSWSVPDSGFGLEFATSLTPPIEWAPLTGPEAASLLPAIAPFTLAAGTRTALVPGSVVTNSPEVFFRLNNQSFVQLQVLMQGETNAPGTPTGKTGTPISQSIANGGVVVTVNACDRNWYLIPSVTDTIHFTSSTDANATPPADTPMVGGTTGVIFPFATPGTNTVTASDVTNPGITPATSSPTKVTP